MAGCVISGGFGGTLAEHQQYYLAQSQLDI